MSLQEIAKIAGVSKSTVSRVINHDERVSDETRARVQKVIQEVGYLPNRAARALVSRRTQAIGVVISDDFGIFTDTSQYFPTILRGISSATTAHDYAMLLFLGEDSEDDYRFARRIVRSQMFDGVILVSPSIGHPVIDEMLSSGMPFVSADRIDRDDAQINYVTVENVQASRKAVRHLIDQNRRRILMIAGNDEIIDTHDRIRGYKQALADAGIPFDPDLLIVGRYSQTSGYNAIQSVIEQQIDFDGVFASQTNIAVGAVNALIGHGIRLPEDVSLIGFDDIPDGAVPQVGISTVSQDVFKRGNR
ncbi:LacI family transcriptional regulator [bacterium]|nr:LacI family transcriptional regulator [bacterium]